MMNLKIAVYAAVNTADFTLSVQAYDGELPIATLGTLNVDDPMLGVRLRDMFQSFRMGCLYGQAPLPIAEEYNPGVEVAGTDLPPRDVGMEQTAIIKHHAR